MSNSPQALSGLYWEGQRFLEKSVSERLEILKALGLKRYQFLTQMPLTESNILVIMRFLGSPERVKFPQLQGAELAGLDLQGVNWIRGNLTGANLQNCCLMKADLIFVNFTQADLRNADLRGATLNESIWLETQVEGCHLAGTIGLTTAQRQELRQKGAIFAAESESA